tara:strand:- start:30144 stop:30479 length:336 start_codon:yes stop_codon:yes gene_type:complete
MTTGSERFHLSPDVMHNLICSNHFEVSFVFCFVAEAHEPVSVMLVTDFCSMGMNASRNVPDEQTLILFCVLRVIAVGAVNARHTERIADDATHVEVRLGRCLGKEAFDDAG